MKSPASVQLQLPTHSRQFSLQVLAVIALSAICAPTLAAEITIAAVGDMIFDRGVRHHISKRGSNYPFAPSLQVLASADVTFGNLESPLTTAPKIGSGVKFGSDPNIAPFLARAGFDVLSVANNHALDCGEIGLLETLRVLNRAKVQPIGAIGSQSSPATLFQNLRGVRLAWLAFSEFASPTSASTCNVQQLNDANLRREIVAAKSRADVIIVSCHWGIEYQIRPTIKQKTWAKIAADCGADVVLGHHPHVWQGVQVLARRNSSRRTLVAYSLGNWIFDVKPGWNPRTRQTAILQLKVSRRGITKARISPYVIRNARPEAANSQQSASFLDTLQVLAGDMKTRMRGDEILLN